MNIMRWYCGRVRSLFRRRGAGAGNELGCYGISIKMKWCC